MYAKNPRWFLTEEQDALRESVARLARERVAPRAAEVDATAQYPQDIFELLAQNGLRRGEAGLKVIMMCELPTNALLADRYLEHFDVLKYFDHWSFSDDVGVYKPDPRIFTHALEGLGVEPVEAAHVGDLRRTDVAGALGMGITSVRYRPWRDDVTEAPEAEVLLDDHTNLPGILGVA